MVRLQGGRKNSHVLQLLNARESNKAPTVFKESAPWYMVKGKPETCLCTRCERLALKFIPSKRAAQHLKIIYETLQSAFECEQKQMVLDSLQLVIAVLGADSKYRMVQESLQPCLWDRKLADTNATCIDGMCPKCGLKNHWTVVRKEFIVEKVDAEGHLSSELRAGAHELWETDMHWPDYIGYRRPTCETKEDDPDYVEGSDSKSKLVMETQTGTLYEFIDSISEELTGYVDHRVLLEQEKRAFSGLLQNCRPGMMLNFKDFAENGTLKNYRLLQSEHWVSIQYTLFISIYQWISASA